MDGRPLLAHLTACLALLSSLGAASTVPRPDSAASVSIADTQLARAERPYKSKEDDSGSGGDEAVWSHSSGLKVPGRFKSSPTGSDTQQIQRFWRHYHGARPGREDKPMRTKEAR